MGESSRTLKHRRTKSGIPLDENPVFSGWLARFVSCVGLCLSVGRKAIGSSSAWVLQGKYDCGEVVE